MGNMEWFLFLEVQWEFPTDVELGNQSPLWCLVTRLWCDRTSSMGRSRNFSSAHVIFLFAERTSSKCSFPGLWIIVE